MFLEVSSVFSFHFSSNMRRLIVEKEERPDGPCLQGISFSFLSDNWIWRPPRQFSSAKLQFFLGGREVTGQFSAYSFFGRSVALPWLFGRLLELQPTVCSACHCLTCTKACCWYTLWCSLDLHGASFGSPLAPAGSPTAFAKNCSERFPCRRSSLSVWRCVFLDLLQFFELLLLPPHATTWLQDIFHIIMFRTLPRSFDFKEHRHV